MTRVARVAADYIRCDTSSTIAPVTTAAAVDTIVCCAAALRCDVWRLGGCVVVRVDVE